MKKLLTGILLLMTCSIFAQDSFKKFRLGLEARPSINWFTPGNAKQFENAGNALAFGFGLHLEIGLTSTISLQTGLGFSYDKGKVNFDAGSLDPVYYLLDKNEEFVEFAEGIDVANYELYALKSRSYDVTYFNIPLILKMKTKEIGLMTYFGQFGANVDVKTKVKVDDIVDRVTDMNVPTEVTDAVLGSGIQPVKASLNIGFGTEFRPAGSTSLFASLSYNHGLTNSITKEDKFLRQLDVDGNYLSTPSQNAIGKSVTLTVGILF